MNTTPDWTRQFVTATTETETGKTVAQFTGWRAVLDPSFARRHGSDEIDLTIVADSGLHGPGQCGTDCHESGDRAVFMCGMSVPDGGEREQIDAARTALAEQGFRVDGPWVAGPNGTLTAPLVPVMLDPDLAAYEPQPVDDAVEIYTSGEIVHVDSWGDLEFKVCGTEPSYDRQGQRSEVFAVASLSGNITGKVDRAELRRVAS
jgi:hypothetical protein